MVAKFCHECGTKLTQKELENEGMVPFCPKCEAFRFPMYNVAVSMIVINKQTNKILLIKQYGKDYYVLVAGYVNRTEQLEHAVAREIKEETGMTVSSIKFNRTQFYEPSDVLMCNFTKCERKAPKFIYGDISSLKNNDSISLFFIVLYF